MSIKIGAYHFFFSRRAIAILGMALFFNYFWFCLPDRLFDLPRSTIILDRHGELLNAQIASDGQWRFPAIDSVPYRFKHAIIQYEDADFYKHSGIAFTAIGRAILLNISAGKVVSGGSTLTMQIARMSRQGERTFLNKFIEMIWALRLELKFNKKELLEIYASNAPFGGNVVGLEAASWRYYQLPPHRLSWSQSATLAVLPNAPSLIHPGKNRQQLKAKRNFVLKKLRDEGIIDSMTYNLSVDESLVAAPKRLPMMANHLLQKVIIEQRSGERIRTTLDIRLQRKMQALMHRHQKRLNENYIHNAALLIIDTRTNEVKSYIGNTAKAKKHERYVNIIHARRSTGSLLKPFLYTAMTQEGLIQNNMLIPDVPVRFDNFAPKNFNRTHDGAVRVEDALARSLNVPAVRLLQKYGLKKFIHLLQSLGHHYVDKSAEHYGLSLILGGAESSLWDLCQTYSGMVKTLNYFNAEKAYSSHTWKAPKWQQVTQSSVSSGPIGTPFRAGAIYQIFQALLKVNRPGIEASWQNFSSGQQIAWKTGTSFGNRDAWAIGCSPRYVVGVWTGNASGEGRPGLIGSSTAGPILFDVFANLPEQRKRWFAPPEEEMKYIDICTSSGHRATEKCVSTEEVFLYQHASRTSSCQFHETFLTDSTADFRYHMDCAPKGVVQSNRFVLPALQGWYYKKKHPDYRGLPDLHPSCQSRGQESKFAVIYPKNGSQIVDVRDLNGDQNEIVFEAAHQDASSKLFWHIDDRYLGMTEDLHKINYKPRHGEHQLIVLDEKGYRKSISFSVLDAAK